MKQLELPVARIEAELIRQSLLAMGRTAPNPPVACVLAVRYQDDSGWHLFGGATEPPGQKHAEVVCLDRYAAHRAGRSVDEAHLYVTLEPCSRQGRTPPCVDRILQYPEIQSIHIYTADPTIQAEGLQRLRAAHRQVIMMPEDSELQPADLYLRGWLGRVQSGTPRLHAKLAMTADGWIGTLNRRVLISGSAASGFGQVMRRLCDAVLVGPGTLWTDLPGLDLRPADATELRQFWQQKHMHTADPLRVGNQEWATGLPGDSTTPMDGRPQSRADALVSGRLFRHLELIMESAERDLRAYQPRRILMPGRFSEQRLRQLSAVINRQNELELSTGQAAVFFLTGPDAIHWRRHLPENRCRQLPAFDDRDFVRELQQSLTDLGLNEILVEGGARLLERLIGVVQNLFVLRSNQTGRERGIQESDRPVAAPGWIRRLVQSTETTLTGELPREVRSTVQTYAGQNDEFLELSNHAVYDLGPDKLEVVGIRHKIT